MKPINLKVLVLKPVIRLYSQIAKYVKMLVFLIVPYKKTKFVNPVHPEL